MGERETILFAPLNWGLGHATRMVPLIHASIKSGNDVILAADGAPLEFLKLEFPDAKALKFKGYKIRYAQPPFFLACLLLQMPFFYISFWLEHYRLSKIIRRYKISTVISDNRYGLWNRNIKSILITHQLFIKLPKSIKFLEGMLHKTTGKLIQRFTECWVPDYENFQNSLAGTLSHGLPLPNIVKYIGPLSRFKNFEYKEVDQKLKSYNVLVLISGPEPQRTSFEREMVNRFIHSDMSILMVCGKPGNDSQNAQTEIKNITKVEHLNTATLYYHLTHSKQIIARSGYSTIMDLHVLNLTAELIPTPGQTEQEYLAQWLNAQKSE